MGHNRKNGAFCSVFSYIAPSGEAVDFSPTSARGLTPRGICAILFLLIRGGGVWQASGKRWRGWRSQNSGQALALRRPSGSTSPRGKHTQAGAKRPPVARYSFDCGIIKMPPYVFFIRPCPAQAPSVNSVWGRGNRWHSYLPLTMHSKYSKLK